MGRHLSNVGQIAMPIRLRRSRISRNAVDSSTSFEGAQKVAAAAAPRAVSNLPHI